MSFADNLKKSLGFEEDDFGSAYGIGEYGEEDFEDEFTTISPEQTFYEIILIRPKSVDDMDYVLIQIKDGLCIETMLKDEQEKMRNIHNLNMLTSYLEDNSRIVLVFNKVEYVCLRKENIVGDENKLKAYLQKIMDKTANKKK